MFSSKPIPPPTRKMLEEASWALYLACASWLIPVGLRGQLFSGAHCPGLAGFQRQLVLRPVVQSQLRPLPAACSRSLGPQSGSTENDATTLVASAEGPRIEEPLSPGAFPRPSAPLVPFTQRHHFLSRERHHRLPRIPDHDGEEDEGYGQRGRDQGGIPGL